MPLGYEKEEEGINSNKSSVTIYIYIFYVISYMNFYIDNQATLKQLFEKDLLCNCLVPGTQSQVLSTSTRHSQIITSFPIPALSATDRARLFKRIKQSNIVMKLITSIY